jgi:ketosteroid isomerase-like protein
MSRENVELVRRYWEAWEAGDLSAALEFLSEDLVTHQDLGVETNTAHGKEGFLAMAAEWNEGFAEWTITAEEFLDAGDRILVRNHHTGRGEASKAAVEAEYWFIYTVRDGEIAQLDLHVSRSKALEAVGLSE